MLIIRVRPRERETFLKGRVVKTRDQKLKLRDKNGLPLWLAALDRAS